MKICAEHWAAVRAAVHVRGLSLLVVAIEEEAAIVEAMPAPMPIHGAALLIARREDFPDLDWSL